MSEFPGHNFGNLPPGVYENDPDAPWNQDEPVPPAPEELLDEIYSLLREAGHEPSYKGMRVKCWGLYVDVRED